MKRILLVTILLLFILLFGCSPINESDAIPYNKSRVSFTLPATTGSNTPNELIYIDINADNPTLKHIPLTSGYNEIDLSKNGTHLLGLVSNGEVNRSIGSAISTLGNIGVISNGLDSLPLSDNASDTIDLGDLTKNNEVFGSTVNESTISEETGYSTNTLSGFGEFDETTMKFLNPDIDADGVYDIEESLTWYISSEYLFSYRTDSFNMETSEVNLSVRDFFVPVRMLIYFFAENGFGVLPDDLKQVRLIFPEDLTVINDSNQIVTYINPRLKQSDDNIYQFELTNIKDPKPFFGGNYQMDIAGKYYYFNNMYFVNPDKSYNGMLFPIFDALDDGTYFTKLRYCWKMVENGKIRDASSNEIGIIIKSAHFEFVNNYPIYTFSIKNLSLVRGEINISNQKIRLSEFTYPGMSIRDASRNQYQFWYNFNG